MIQELLARVAREQGEYTLDSLRGMTMAQVEARLRPYRGVGIKTIRCVQAFSLGLPAFPVDTHVLRITKRLGLVPQAAGAEPAHRIMEDLTPPAARLSFHLNLIAHGRRICTAARPRCDLCVLRRSCRYFREQATAPSRKTSRAAGRRRSVSG